MHALISILVQLICVSKRGPRSLPGALIPYLMPNALEILQSCTKPSVCNVATVPMYHVNESAPFLHGVYNDDVIKWKHFPRYWPCVRGIHRSPVNSPHKGQWRGALMLSLICAWTDSWANNGAAGWMNSWVNNHVAGDLRHQHTHYDVTVMKTPWLDWQFWHNIFRWIVFIYTVFVAICDPRRDHNINKTQKNPHCLWYTAG